MATLYIRNFDDNAAARIKRAAQVRGLTLAEYIERLEGLRRTCSTQRGVLAEPLETSGLALPTED